MYHQLQQNDGNSSSHHHLTPESQSAVDFWARLQATQRALNDQQQNTIKLVGLLENVQKQWRLASLECARLGEQNDRLRLKSDSFEQALQETKEELMRLNSELAAAKARERSLEEELVQYRERFNMAKATIQNANFVLPPTKVESANSETDTVSTDSRNGNGKRRSNSVGILPDKRAKRLMDLDKLIEEDQLPLHDDDEDEPKPLLSRVSRQRTMNRSMSESRLEDIKETIAKQEGQQQMAHRLPAATSTLDMRLSPMVGFGNGWTRGMPVEESVHQFVPHNNLFSVAFSYCAVCARSLGMRGLKCNDCKLAIHENCRQHAPLPCVPIIPTPQRNNPKQRVRLADLCPDTQPKIPGQLIRSIVALERGFINTTGLYRVPGCDSEVKKLKDQFNSKYVPKLDKLDPETITGYIKKFLRDLREPLVPFSSFREFSSAVSTGNEEQLKYAIETLPVPNRDTLAFLCAHWQKVAMRSNENQMPIENLAKVLGPTVVGTASKLTHLQPTPSGGGGNGPTSSSSAASAAEAQRQFMEAGQQNQILLALLKLDHDYWTSFYNVPAQPQQPLTGGSGTPVGTPRGGAAGTLIRRNTPLAGSRGNRI